MQARIGAALRGSAARATTRPSTPFASYGVPEKAASKGYSVLFHEAMVPNMLGPFLNHEHACKVMGGAPLLELIDFCMRKIVRLHYRPRDEVEKVLFVPAKELAAQMGTVRGSRRPRRRPACPLARVLHPWHRMGSVRSTWACGGSQGRQEHP